jgi:hypothetical protein
VMSCDMSSCTYSLVCDIHVCARRPKSIAPSRRSTRARRRPLSPSRRARLQLLLRLAHRHRRACAGGCVCVCACGIGVCMRMRVCSQSPRSIDKPASFSSSPKRPPPPAGMPVGASSPGACACCVGVYVVTSCVRTALPRPAEVAPVSPSENERRKHHGKVRGGAITCAVCVHYRMCACDDDANAQHKHHKHKRSSEIIDVEFDDESDSDDDDDADTLKKSATTMSLGTASSRCEQCDRRSKKLRRMPQADGATVSRTALVCGLLVMFCVACSCRCVGDARRRATRPPMTKPARRRRAERARP